MAALTSITFPKTGTSWPSSDTSIRSASELSGLSDACAPYEMTEERGLSADVLKACRRIDQIQIEKKANERLYLEQTDRLQAEMEAEKNEEKKETLYRMISGIIDRYFKVSKALDTEEAAMRKILYADIHAMQQRRNEEEREIERARVKDLAPQNSDQTRCLKCWGCCEQLEALLKQRTSSESDALQYEAENLLREAMNARTLQELEALLPAINDMICSLQVTLPLSFHIRRARS